MKKRRKGKKVTQVDGHKRTIYLIAFKRHKSDKKEVATVGTITYNIQ